MIKIWLVIYVMGQVSNSMTLLDQTMSGCNKKSNELMSFAKDAGYSYEYFHTKCEAHITEPKKGTKG